MKNVKPLKLEQRLVPVSDIVDIHSDTKKLCQQLDAVPYRCSIDIEQIAAVSAAAPIFCRHENSQLKVLAPYPWVPTLLRSSSSTAVWINIYDDKRGAAYWQTLSAQLVVFPYTLNFDRTPARVHAARLERMLSDPFYRKLFPDFLPKSGVDTDE